MGLFLVSGSRECEELLQKIEGLQFGVEIDETEGIHILLELYRFLFDCV